MVVAQFGRARLPPSRKARGSAGASPSQKNSKARHYRADSRRQAGGYFLANAAADHTSTPLPSASKITSSVGPKATAFTATGRFRVNTSLRSSTVHTESPPALSATASNFPDGLKASWLIGAFPTANTIGAAVFAGQ